MRKSRFSVALALLVTLIISGVALGQDAPASNPSAATKAVPFGPPFKWTSTGPLIGAASDPTGRVLAVKDPSIVFFDGRWHLFATSAEKKGWGMLYYSFADWKDAASAKPCFLDANPNLRGYKCAPQVFYFRPQKKWYMVYQTPDPAFSTSDDLSKPESWSPAERFFAQKPASVVKGWIDFWVICDDTHAYLFFCDDEGRFYRSRTKIQDFPHGFSDPEVALQDANRFALFEACCTYQLKGTGQYLTVVEALGKYGVRYFRGFLADRLDGQWRPCGDTWENPFASGENIVSESGGKAWSNDVSHGELIRDGYDERMIVDPAHLQFLYQGLKPGSAKGLSYLEAPWELALLRLQAPAK